ncbi:asparaginase [Candidatus Formimonas warabiya]|uniref:Asparaginase n=1 Tax=Formimonas warabiya TaxID=1761012 RepID=A0A3G1KNI0_FORW1|nr:asparaginase [Candidatus Formimonas warabiya]ATW23675.1 hypothetical protein DCMF_01695 [Candidatus Formimonas warabiya]
MENILVSVTRGPIQESCHRGHVAVVDTAGNVVSGFGDPNIVTFFRSAAKPIQILSLVESGALKQFGFSPQEVAIMAGSHTGEEFHIRTIQNILGKIDLPVTALQCGIHIPLHRNMLADANMEEEKKKFTPLHNNCSGKHVATLALCVFHKWSTEDYLNLSHPVQQLNLKTISGMSGIPEEKIHLGIDGCSAPVYGIPLRAMAFAYARLTAPHKLSATRQAACNYVSQAIMKHPEMSSGTGRLCARIMTAAKGKILAKLGAEAVYCLGLPRLGLGVAVKIEDGADRPIAPAVIEVIKQLDILSAEELANLADLHHPKITNHRDIVVGSINPVFVLQRQRQA